ncbi:helix-turn-helix domain-containing protein [Halegenticoccus tardaugens]|uniref:helix-turn-helix domain-containing protein n=1 Tax=Halegenticoccus tardaugens TaxID=2071624 RepID=UPI00100B073D|nr:helix-turn-helix domain-containing protein [Halegenticoccus tardaugens]
MRTVLLVRPLGYTMISAELELTPTVDGHEAICLPDLVVELDAKRTSPSGGIIVLMWVSGEGFDAFESHLAAEPVVRGWSLLVDERGVRLYRIRYTEEWFGREFHERCVELDATIVDGVGTENGWLTQIRFVDHRSFRELCHWLDERGVRFRLRSVSRIRSVRNGVAHLTDTQREALSLAYELGYYDIPRRATLGEVAAELGISGQACSERLRRASAKLIQTYGVES